MGNYKATKVICLGYSVGNLWNITINDVHVGRASYHGNTLVITPKDSNISIREVEKAINRLYDVKEESIKINF